MSRPPDSPESRDEALRDLDALYQRMMAHERDLIRFQIGERMSVVIRVSGGDFGAKQLDRLIRLLEVQRDVLVDDAAVAP